MHKFSISLLVFILSVAEVHSGSISELTYRSELLEVEKYEGFHDERPKSARLMWYQIRWTGSIQPVADTFGFNLRIYHTNPPSDVDNRNSDDRAWNFTDINGGGFRSLHIECDDFSLTHRSELRDGNSRGVIHETYGSLKLSPIGPVRQIPLKVTDAVKLVGTKYVDMHPHETYMRLIQPQQLYVRLRLDRMSSGQKDGFYSS